MVKSCQRDITASINTISVVISAGFTLEQLAVQDFFFQPDYDRPWHYLNVLAQQALGDTFGSDRCYSKSLNLIWDKVLISLGYLMLSRLI